MRILWRVFIYIRVCVCVFTGNAFQRLLVISLVQRHITLLIRLYYTDDIVHGVFICVYVFMLHNIILVHS
jgi:hypothetical protein